MDTQWIKAAAARVRSTVRQAIDKVDRIGNGAPERVRRPASNDAADARNHPESKDPEADTK